MVANCSSLLCFLLGILGLLLSVEAAASHGFHMLRQIIALSVILCCPSCLVASCTQAASNHTASVSFEHSRMSVMPGLTELCMECPELCSCKRQVQFGLEDRTIHSLHKTCSCVCALLCTSMANQATHCDLLQCMAGCRHWFSVGIGGLAGGGPLQKYCHRSASLQC